MLRIRNLILTVCVAVTVVGVIIHWHTYFSKQRDASDEIVFWALFIAASLGSLGLVLQLLATRVAQVLTCLFFGFLAGIMATNFARDIAEGTVFSMAGYFVSYGLEVLFLALSVIGLILFQGPAERIKR